MKQVVLGLLAGAMVFGTVFALTAALNLTGGVIQVGWERGS